MHSEVQASAIDDDDFKIFNVSTTFIRIMPTENDNQNNEISKDTKYNSLNRPIVMNQSLITHKMIPAIRRLRDSL